MLRRLEPDLLITQTLCEVCAVAESEVRDGVAQLPGSPQVVNLEPTRLDEVLDSIVTVGEATANVKTAQQVVRVCKERIARVRRAALPNTPPKKVVVLEWLDPLFSCGHWTPELVEIAGGVEPLVQSGMRSREISAADVTAADPDVILIACCGFGVGRAMRDVPLLMGQAAIARLRCVCAGRVYVTDGSAYFSRPGPRLVDSLEILANVMDPERHSLPADVPSASRVDLC
jgi:iron complex transport system substrate-binding protein